MPATTAARSARSHSWLVFVALAAALQLILLHAISSLLPASWRTAQYWLQAAWGVAAGAQIALVMIRRPTSSRRSVLRSSNRPVVSSEQLPPLEPLSPVPDLVHVTQPMQFPASATIKSFPPVRHVFRASFEAVVAALHTKYQLPQDPHHPYVRTVRVVYDQSFAGDGYRVRHVRREVTSSLEFVPALMRRWLGGGDALTVLEELDVRQHARTLHTRVINTDMHSVGQFEQLATYVVHHDDPNWTLFTAHVKVATGSWIGRQLMSYTGEDAQPLLEAHIAALEDRLRATRGTNEAEVVTAPLDASSQLLVAAASA